MSCRRFPRSLEALVLVYSCTLPWLGVQAATASDPAQQVSPETTDVRSEEAERERRIHDRTERAKREAEFNQLDSDGDGYLSKAEITAKEDLAPGPQVLDRDNDGRISRTEFAAVETSSVGPETPAVNDKP